MPFSSMRLLLLFLNLCEVVVSTYSCNNVLHNLGPNCEKSYMFLLSLAPTGVCWMKPPALWRFAGNQQHWQCSAAPVGDKPLLTPVLHSRQVHFGCPFWVGSKVHCYEFRKSLAFRQRYFSIDLISFCANRKAVCDIDVLVSVPSP